MGRVIESTNGGHPPPIYSAVEENTASSRDQEKSELYTINLYTSSLYSSYILFYIYVKRIYPARDPTCIIGPSTAQLSRDQPREGGRTYIAPPSN
jgi:hypothetical protein